MTTPKNAARVAVAAAALPNQAQTQPRDVFDCIAAGIPRGQWEAALTHVEATEWNAWLGQAHAKTSFLDEQEQQLRTAREAQRQERIRNGIFDLGEGLWRMESACSALSAVWQLTDACASRTGDTLDLPAQDIANLLKSVHAEIARRTEAVEVISNALHSAWKDEA